MTAAPHGKRRPGIAEAADLVWERCGSGASHPATAASLLRRDALAALSVVLPVIVLMTTAVQVAWALHALPGGFSSPEFRLLAHTWLPVELTAPLALLALAMLRLQRAAALAVVALLIWLAYLAGSPYLRFEYVTTVNPYILLAVGLQIVAVTASPGPRRGLQLLTWKHAALTVVAAGAVAVASYPWTLVVIPVICAAMALTSSLGRWLLVLLAIPLGPYFATPLYGSIGTGEYATGRRAAYAPRYRARVARRGLPAARGSSGLCS